MKRKILPFRMDDNTGGMVEQGSPTLKAKGIVRFL